MPEHPGFPTSSPGLARPYRWEKAGLIALAVALVGLGVMTDIRSALQSRPKTDFQVYARAAWAVRIGADIYMPTDDNGWHYIYPPTFAILLAPLADPYPFLGRGNYLPFWVSVAIWYVFSTACAMFAVHALAGAVLPGTPRGSRRWWSARVMPFLIGLGGIGLTLSRGQVNTFLVALVAAGFAASARGRRVVSGVWLAGAAVLKVIPAFLVLYPLVRRDGRALAGVGLGAVVLLGVIPVAVWGVPKAIEANKKAISLVVAPAVSGDAAPTLKKELHGANSTDSQSVQMAIHAWEHPDRDSRPDVPSTLANRTHWASGGLLVVLTVLAARQLTPDVGDQLVFLGCLSAVMMLLTPISHLHYYAMVLPLVSGLWLRSLARRPGQVWADPWTTAVLVAWGLATAIPIFPGPIFDRLRECGFGTVATVGLWAFGLWTIGRKTAAAEVIPEPIPARRAA